MGAVACNKHGTHPGRQCCDHVRVAAQQLGDDLPFDTYRGDLLDDATELLEFLICTPCARQFQLSLSETIPRDVCESAGRFPYVCPTCVHCLAEWANKHGKALHQT